MTDVAAEACVEYQEAGGFLVDVSSVEAAVELGFDDNLGEQ